MIHMKQLSFIIFSFLILYGNLQGQVKYSNEFLSIGVGARMMGTGGAGTAMVDDVTAGYWNPSRLLNTPGKLDFGLMHSEYFAGLAKYDYGGVVYRLDEKSSAGLSLIRFAVDDIPNTLELIDKDGNIRYDRISTFSSADFGLLFSYARKTRISGLQVGGNAKLIYRHTGDFAKAWGFGLDAAVSWSVGKWNLSGVARDITGTFNAWSFDEEALKEVFELTGNELPDNSLEITVPRLILGATRDFRISEKLHIAPAMDLHVTFDGRRHVILPLGPVSIDPCTGVEIRYNKWLFGRLGVGNFQLVPGFSGKNYLSLQPSLGLGIQFRNFYLDYAMTDVGNLALAQYSNLISVRYVLK